MPERLKIKLATGKIKLATVLHIKVNDFNIVGLPIFVLKTVLKVCSSKNVILLFCFILCICCTIVRIAIVY